MASLNTLSELSHKLRQAALLMKDKGAAGATVDVETLAKYARLAAGTVGSTYNVQAAALARMAFHSRNS